MLHDAEGRRGYQQSLFHWISSQRLFHKHVQERNSAERVSDLLELCDVEVIASNNQRSDVCWLWLLALQRDYEVAIQMLLRPGQRL